MEPPPFHSLVAAPRGVPMSTSRGFTLVELIVVLAIIGIITLIAVLGQSTFDQSLLLTDTTYTLAFSVREAQTLGLSTRQFVDASGGITTNPGYGIHIDKNKPNTYALYSDISPTSGNGFTTNQLSGLCPGHTAPSGDPDAKPGNCLYDSSSELVEQYVMNRGYTIARVCGQNSSNGTNCSDDQSNPLAQIDIEFMRPSTQSVVTGTLSNGTQIKLSSATIYVQAPTGQVQRCVYVSQLGQIAVNYKGDANCP